MAANAPCGVAVAYWLTGSSRSGAVRLIERDLAGEALIDEPV
jgi:hypothetical protein